MPQYFQANTILIKNTFACICFSIPESILISRRKHYLGKILRILSEKGESFVIMARKPIKFTGEVGRNLGFLFSKKHHSQMYPPRLPKRPFQELITG